MTETSQDMTPAEEDVTEAKAPSGPTPGELVKKRRDEMGLSYGRVADALHITAHYVKALESDEYDKLPGKTFVKGYFKAYAKLLNLDIDEVMSCYERHIASLEESEKNEAQEERAQKAYDQNLRWTICAAVIIVVVLGLSWWLSQEESSSASAIAGSTTSTVAETMVTDDDPVASLTQDDEPVTAEVLVATLADSPTNQPAGGQASANMVITEAVVAESTAPGESAALPVAEAVENRQQELQEQPEQEQLAESEVDSEEAGAAGQADIVNTPEGESELVSGAGLPDYTVTRIDNHRRVEMQSEGNDLLEVHFSGQSWIEVDDADNTRLYHDMLYSGDDLMIRGKAPFNILLGDATMVDMTFNSRSVDISSRIRTDNTARIMLEPETR